MTNFQELIARLIQNQVQFIVVGGAAGIAHGASRLTQDLDVVYQRSEANYQAIQKALSVLDPRLRGAPEGIPFIFDTRTIRAGLNFTLNTKQGDIDLLGEILAGGNYENLLSHSVDIQLFGFSCKCLDLPKLIEVKKATGRLKDLEAVSELEELLKER
jgi:predicted nucleotidyltransferase